MLAIVLSLLAVRGVRALFGALLGALAVASAVAAPAYVTAADQELVTAQMAAASATEAAIWFRRPVPQQGTPPDDTFERSAAERLAVPGFTPVFDAQFDVGPVPAGTDTGLIAGVWRMAYRDGVCGHVTLSAGRCPVGVGEVILGQVTAGALGLSVGQTRTFKQVIYRVVDQIPTPFEVGDPVTVSVVGVYRPTDRREPYWGPAPPFEAGGVDVATVEPVYGTRDTTKLFALQVPEFQGLDLIPQPGSLTAARVRTLFADLDRLALPATNLGELPETNLPKLIDSVTVNQSFVGRLVPFAGLPLVPLCWYVIFLAAAYAADERRSEVGLFGLRGLRRPQRWWLAAGEQVLPLLIGAPIGYLVGYLAVRAGARLAFGTQISLPISTGPLPYAAAALGGALAAGLLAYRRDLATPVLDLLRRVPPRGGRWRSVALEAIAAVVAVVAIVDARIESGAGSGDLILLAPALLQLAGALLVARALRPATERIGRRALDRGRIAPALAAIELARRPNTRRVLALSVLSVSLLFFGVIAVDAASAARTQRIGVELGADRVLSVAHLPAAALLDRVRQVDPQGAYAMAVVRLPSTAGVPATLAVDTTRLATVAKWPDALGGTGVRQLGAQLHPPAGQPIRLDGGRIAVELTVDGSVDPQLTLYILLQARDGRMIEAPLGNLRTGRHSYEWDASGCAEGCRLAEIHFNGPTLPRAPVDLVLHGIRQLGPDRTLWSSGWHAGLPGAGRNAPALQAGPDGLRIINPIAGDRILPADAPLALPAVVRTPLGTDAVIGPDERRMAMTQIDTVSTLPGGREAGALVDLEYLTRTFSPADAGESDEVWLGPRAPADVLSRLAGAGLVVGQDTHLSDRMESGDHQGPALAMSFHLVAGGFTVLLAILGLAIAVVVDRRRRAGDLGPLRAQGLPAAVLARAGAAGQLWLAAVALLAGPVLALVAWLAVGQVIPVFTDQTWPLAVPLLPRPVPVLIAWAGVAVLLGAFVVVAGRALRRADDLGGNS